jgi:hypothetical protein
VNVYPFRAAAQIDARLSGMADHVARCSGRKPDPARQRPGNRRGLLGAESVMADILTPFPNVAAEEPR